MNDFTQVLGDNIRNTTSSAVLMTVVSEPARSIGEILEALEKEPELNYLLATFKAITIADVIEAHASILAMAEASRSAMAAAAAAPDPEPAPEPEPVKAKAKSGAAPEGKSKKKAPKKTRAKADGKSPKDSGKIDLSDPDAIKVYEAKITKFLRTASANDEESAMSAQAIRSGVGGSPDQLRKRLNALIEAKSLDYTGKARGTKYFLA
jgi:hypothetical protein